MATPSDDRIYDPAEAAGRTVRRRIGDAVEQQKRIGRTALTAATIVPRTAIGAGTAFVRGLSGAEPVAPARAAAVPARGGVDFTRPAPLANEMDFAKPAHATAAPGGAPSFANVSNGPRAGDPNTFTANGVTRRVMPAAATAPANAAAGAPPPITRALEPVTTRDSYAPQVQVSTARTVQGQRDATRTTRADAAEVLNPMSAGGELLRRLENSQSSFQHRGSPSARAAVAQALLGQLGAQNAASATGQEGTSRALLQGADNEYRANEGFAERRLDADQFNVNAGQAADELAQRGRQPSQIVRGLDGRNTLLRNDGGTSTLRDEEGNPVLTPDPSMRPDTVTADTQFKALADQLESAKQSGRPDPRKDAEGAAAYDESVGAIHARMDALVGGRGGGGSGGTAPPPAAIQKLKANPKTAADFDAIFGPGAAARYLAR